MGTELSKGKNPTRLSGPPALTVTTYVGAVVGLVLQDSTAGYGKAQGQPTTKFLGPFD